MQRHEGAACHPFRDGHLWLNKEGSKGCWNRGQMREKQGKFAACMEEEHVDLILPRIQQ